MKNTDKQKTSDEMARKAWLVTLKRILGAAFAVLVVAFLAVAFYQIVKVLFIGAVLLSAWIFPKWRCK